MGFNKVLDFSDFMDGDDHSVQQANNLVRPCSSNANQRRGVQTAHGMRTQGIELLNNVLTF